MGGETKKPIAKASNVPSNSKPRQQSDNNSFKSVMDDIYGVVKGSVDTKLDQGKAELVKRGAPILRDAIKFAAPVETAMVKNAGTVLNAVGKTAGLVSKAIPIVGGGIPSAVMAVAGDGTQGAKELRKKGYIDGTSPERWAQLQKEQKMRTSPMKNMMTTKMVTTTVKNPSYSGQSAFGKALMGSAKRKG